MLTAILIIFIITACFGAYLLTYVLTSKNTPKGIAIIHGCFGALGLILLAFNAYYHPWLMVIFCIVAIGGFTLISIDLSGRKIPSPLALGHGLLTIIAIISLIYTLLTI